MGIRPEAVGGCDKHSQDATATSALFAVSICRTFKMSFQRSARCVEGNLSLNQIANEE
jgi:hypothetical protein